MSIRYFHPNDEPSWNPWISDGSDDGWWAGVQKCAATIALAATLSITGTSTAQNQQQVTWGSTQDDPTGTLFNFIPDEDYCQRKLYNPNLRAYSQGADGKPVLLFDEDYWQNPVLPVYGSNFVTLPFKERDDYPVGFLFGGIEEDFWQNPVNPTLNPSFVPQQWTFDVREPAGSLIQLQDEDFWQNPVSPVSSYPLPIVFVDMDEIALPTLTIIPDEDFWQSRFVFPNHKVYGRGGGSRANTPDEDSYQQTVGYDFGYIVTLYIDDSTTIVQPLAVDQDVPQNFIQPIASYPVPLVFMDDEIWVPFVPTFPLPFDEEFWPQANAVAPIASYPVPFVFTDDDILVPFAPIVPLPFDEETWQQQVSLDAVNPVTLWVDDTQTIPAPPLLPDEDFWQNPIEPIPPVYTWPQQWTFDTQDAAGSLIAIPDEDFWHNPVQPLAATLGPIYLPDTNDDPAGSLEGDMDEDYWQNPVLPVQAQNYVKLPIIPDPDEIPSGSLSGGPDETFWQNPVAPVPFTLGRIYLPDADDVPVGQLKGQPDEDFWQNPVPPTSSYPVPFVYRDQEEIPAGSLYVHPDEDYWINPVAPISLTFGHLYSPDLDDVPSGSFHGAYEDDSWLNWVRPVPYFVPPVVFSDDEITVPTPPAPIEEDFWHNAVVPLVASNYVSFPYLPDAEEIPAGSLVPPLPPNPCPCSSIPNIPQDRIYDIILCDQGIINNVQTWIACIFVQPNTLLAKRMGQPVTTIYVYGTQQQAFQEARQFVNHNMGTF